MVWGPGGTSRTLRSADDKKAKCYLALIEILAVCAVVILSSFDRYAPIASLRFNRVRRASLPPRNTSMAPEAPGWDPVPKQIYIM